MFRKALSARVHFLKEGCVSAVWNADASQVQADASQVQADASQMQADASQVQADASQMQADASQMQVDALAFPFSYEIWEG